MNGLQQEWGSPAKSGRARTIQGSGLAGALPLVHVCTRIAAFSLSPLPSPALNALLGCRPQFTIEGMALVREQDIGGLVDDQRVDCACQRSLGMHRCARYDVMTSRPPF
jgi:hypothetical protein